MHPQTPRPPGQLGWSTRSVHSGDKRPFPHNSLNLPIFQTATYTFNDTEDLRQFMQARLWGPVEGRTEYGRYGNPTLASVESKLAQLEGGGDAILFSSGMAAITITLLSLLSAGDHLILTDDSYRRTRQFCLTTLKRLGIECSLVPAGDLDQLEAAIRPETKLIVSESPTNPYLRVLDLERLVQIAKRAGVISLIDSTFATPINQRPLEFGIDLVIHSATKYLAGHNDLLAGVVAGSEYLLALIRQNLWVMGATCDPHAAYLIYRGLKTLALRLSRQNETGQRLADFLEAHPRVRRVWYPGLASHPDHAVASRQMDGFGGVVSFELDGDLEAASRLVDSVRLPLIASSLGGVETLIEQPALMSYFELTSEERLQVGIKDN
ncbi:MAG: trans-sulfuration enzyme family protein, partial [Anaerolineales bacterium]